MSSRKRARLHTEILRNTRSTELLFATAVGDVGTVKRLVSRNVVNAETRGTGTLLCIASERGHVEVVKVLLNRGADLNKASKFHNSSTPVHVAALEGHLEVLSLLLSRGAFVDAKNKFGRTPLHQTMCHNKPESATLLLNFEADINASDVYNYSPLHLAARNGHVEMVKIILTMGADVKAANEYLVTPLHLAAFNGHVEVVKLLLNDKALPDVKDTNRKTPLYYAIATNKIETAELLLNCQNVDINELLNIEYDNLLHNKSWFGNVKTIGWLLSKGANVNSVDQHNETPLHSAAMGGHPRAMRMLLSAGASVNASDEWADTPLHLASAYGRTSVVKMLLTAGADVNAANANKHTPLHLAKDDCKEVLQQHVVKRMALNMFVIESNKLEIGSDDGMISFKLDCEKEVELMKSHKMENGVSFFDILTGSTRQLITFTRNKDNMQVFKLNAYLSRFPIYASKIKNRFIPAIKRGETLDLGRKFFDNCLKSLPRLEGICSEEILTYLSNIDLQILKIFKSKKCIL